MKTLALTCTILCCSNFSIAQKASQPYWQRASSIRVLNRYYVDATQLNTNDQKVANRLKQVVKLHHQIESSETIGKVMMALGVTATIVGATIVNVGDDPNNPFREQSELVKDGYRIGWAGLGATLISFPIVKSVRKKKAQLNSILRKLY